MSLSRHSFFPFVSLCLYVWVYNEVEVLILLLFKSPDENQLLDIQFFVDDNS